MQTKDTFTRLTLQHRGDLGEYHANKESGATVARCSNRGECAMIIRAINAAPALLEALRRNLVQLEFTHLYQQRTMTAAEAIEVAETLAQTRAAIAAATGE